MSKHTPLAPPEYRVVRDGDHFEYHHTICGQTNITRCDLYGLFRAAHLLVEQMDGFVAGCSLLAGMLDRKEGPIEDLGEYQQQGIAAILNSFTEAYSALTQERFTELRVFELAEVKPS